MSDIKVQKILVSQPQPAAERNPYAVMAEHYGVQFDFKQLIIGVIDSLVANNINLFARFY